jgi:hypothetical protein
VKAGGISLVRQSRPNVPEQCSRNLIPLILIPTVLTPNANCGKLMKVRNPDQGVKCALPVNIKDPSLAAGDLNALGIEGCAWAEPILQGSALAFPTLRTLSREESIFYSM